MESARFASGAPETPRPRRVMTAPVPASTSPQQPRSSSPSRPAPSESDDLVETLYSHPSVRIISFTSSRRGFAISPLDNDVPPGSLPPSSRLERTIAVGAFRIYRAPGSVAFLSCGSALQPILPKSQCWCLDEDNSRFVLQIRRPQYWRIEVPVADPDDVYRAVLLRDVFDKILLFEKTECPFERSFTVELPDPPETPIKKKAWTADGKNLISSAFDSDLSPTADTPITISRGKRTASINRDMSPASTMLMIADEAQDEVRWRARNQSFGDVLSYFRTQMNTDVPSDIASARSYTLSSGDNDPFTGTLERTGAESLTLSEVGGSTSPSSTSPEAMQLSKVRAPDSSLAETEILCEETRAHSIAVPSLDPAAERLAIQEGNNAHQLPKPLQQSFISDQKNDDVLEPVPSDGEDSPASFEGSGGVAPVNLARKRVTRMLAGRSFKRGHPEDVPVTAPPPPAPVASSTKSRKPVTARKESQSPPVLARVQSPSASTDSFHSVQSWHSSGLGESSFKVESVGLPQSPSPSPSPATYSLDHITTPKNTINVVPGPSVSDICSSAEPTPRPIRFVTDEKSEKPIHSEGEPRVSREFHRRRSHAGSVSIGRRALSPLPSAANLFTPPRRHTPQSRLATVRKLPAAIIHKTMEILLSPPSHLIKLMLKVAAMIVAGEWRGLVFGFGEAGEQIPVQWDYYSDGEFSDFSDSDDYTSTTHSSNYSNSVPRAGLRRRTRWANDDDRYGSSVD